MCILVLLITGTEWQYWLLFYSLPLLIGLLPNTYYIHYCALVGSISILLSSNISLLDLDRAHILMDEFCRHAGALYGESKCECIVYGALHAFQCETQGHGLVCKYIILLAAACMLY